jgi:hypothetical protein
MIRKSINDEQFKEAIKVSFSDDKEIFSLYNPHIKVESVDDIVNDISYRIKNEVNNAIVKGVYEKNELVGFYAYEGHTLISFALNVKYRTRRYLNGLFSLIRGDIKGQFQCFLFNKNIRAIKYLSKQGMKIGNSNELITHLIL